MSTGLGNIMERQKAMIHSLFYLLLKNDFCQLQGPSRHTERLVSNISKTETWKMKRDKPVEMLNKRKKIWITDDNYFTEQHTNAGL